MEVVAALATFQQVLQQVEDLGIPLGPPAPLLLQLLRRSQVSSSTSGGTGTSIQVSLGWS